MAPRLRNPTRSSARNVSMLSANDTRMPFRRSRPANSMIFASTTNPRADEARRLLRNLEENDRPLLLAIGEIDIEMQAPPLQRVRHLAGVVAGEDDDRHVPRFERTELRHAHLEIGEHLEQEGLELAVGFVD